MTALAPEVGAEVDPSRLRANILVDEFAPFGEDSLVGQYLRIGDVFLEITMPSPRCVMIDMQTADLPSLPRNLLAVGGSTTRFSASLRESPNRAASASALWRRRLLDAIGERLIMPVDADANCIPRR